MDDSAAVPWDGTVLPPEVIAVLARFPGSLYGSRPPDWVAYSTRALTGADTVTARFTDRKPHRIEVVAFPAPPALPYLAASATVIRGFDELHAFGGITTAGDTIAVWASSPPSKVSDSQANAYVRVEAQAPSHR